MAWPIIEPKRVRAINSCVWDTTSIPLGNASPRPRGRLKGTRGALTEVIGMLKTVAGHGRQLGERGAQG